MHGYRQLPVYKAAQAVQRSADGYAYIQYQPQAFRMSAAFTGRKAHSVWCWSPGGSSGSPRLSQADAALRQTFGSLGARKASSPGDAPTLVVHAPQPLGWAVATWLVTHAGKYHIREVSCDGFRWRASSGSDGWIKDKNDKNVAIGDAVQAS